jgi:mono/diheme cytochrome c family protein
MKAMMIAFALLLAAPAVAHADGKASYTKLCKSCHGADGKGNPEKAKVLKIDPQLLNLGREETKNLTDAELEAIVKDGKKKMPSYKKKLDAAETKAVIEYAKQLAAAIRAGK